MLDRRSLSPEACAFYDSLPHSDQLALQKSNEIFRTLDELQSYATRMAAHAGEVLYQTLPEPGVPSNQALDELDSE